MGKGDHYRPVDKKKFDKNFEQIFGTKKLNVWEDPPEKPDEEKRERPDPPIPLQDRTGEEGTPHKVG